MRRRYIGLAAAGIMLAAPLAHAQSKAGVNDFRGFMQRVTGNSTTVGVGSNGTLVATTAPTNLSGSGWVAGANFATRATAEGIELAMAGSSTVAGKSIPVLTRSMILKAHVLDGMGMALNLAKGGGLAGMAALFAAPLMIDMMASSAGEIQANPDPSTKLDKPFLMTVPGFKWCVVDSSGNTTSYCASSAGVAYGAWSGAHPGGTCNGGHRPPRTTFQVSATPTSEVWNYKNPGCDGTGEYFGNDGIGPLSVQKTAATATPTPANWSEVRPKFEAMPLLPSDVLQKQIDYAKSQEGKNGICDWATNPKSCWAVTVQPPTITPPTTVPPETKTETKTEPWTDTQGRPGTKQTTTTTTTTNPVIVTGDTMKIDPKTTTTTTTKTTDGDGLVTEKTDTTEVEKTEDNPNEKPEKETDLCKANPDILACKKLDLPPDVQIPKTDNTVVYAPQDLGLGSGSCPPPVTFTLTQVGRTYAIPFSDACDFMTNILKPLFISLATLTAFFIIAPGKAN